MKPGPQKPRPLKQAISLTALGSENPKLHSQGVVRVLQNRAKNNQGAVHSKGFRSLMLACELQLRVEGLKLRGFPDLGVIHELCSYTVILIT